MAIPINIKENLLRPGSSNLNDITTNLANQYKNPQNLFANSVSCGSLNKQNLLNIANGINDKLAKAAAVVGAAVAAVALVNYALKNAGALIDGAINLAKNIAGAVMDKAKELVGAVGDMANAVVAAVKAMPAAIASTLGAIKNKISSAIGSIKKAITNFDPKKAINNLLDKFKVTLGKIDLKFPSVNLAGMISPSLSCPTNNFLGNLGSVMNALGLSNPIPGSVNALLSKVPAVPAISIPSINLSTPFGTIPLNPLALVNKSPALINSLPLPYSKCAEIRKNNTWNPPITPVLGALDSPKLTTQYPENGKDLIGRIDLPTLLNKYKFCCSSKKCKYTEKDKLINRYNIYELLKRDNNSYPVKLDDGTYAVNEYRNNIYGFKEDNVMARSVATLSNNLRTMEAMNNSITEVEHNHQLVTDLPTNLLINGNYLKSLNKTTVNNNYAIMDDLGEQLQMLDASTVNYSNKKSVTGKAEANMFLLNFMGYNSYLIADVHGMDVASVKNRLYNYSYTMNGVSDSINNNLPKEYGIRFTNEFVTIFSPTLDNLVNYITTNTEDFANNENKRNEIITFATRANIKLEEIFNDIL